MLFSSSFLLLFKNNKMNIIKLGLIILMGCSSSKVLLNNEGQTYYPIGSENSIFRYFGSDNFVKHKDIPEKKTINGKIYSLRQIEYSWGNSVITYLREENNTIFYYDEKSDSENVILPNGVMAGYTWVNTDESWEYLIVDLNGKLKTPEKTYTGLLVIKAIQTKNRDENKLSEYLNYYQKGIGKIASVGNGQLLTYRVESEKL
jgi:hypothetical protein